MTARYCIIDCFVDEPACFGVPPFISPYPRYVYGALIDAGVPEDAVVYRTIDFLRERHYTIDEHFDHVFLIGGAVVPGKYLGARIGTIPEITSIIKQNRHVRFSVGGMSRFMIQDSHENLTIAAGDIESYAYCMGINRPADRPSTYDEIARWAVKGAVPVRHHPDFPDIILEIETYKGCPRRTHCSFCSEGLTGAVRARRVRDILAEIDALIEQGVTRFRLGRQADILQYGTRNTDYSGGFPRPDPPSVRELFSELKSRRDSGHITTLNVDNANPGTIVHFPEESSQILEYITDAITPGETLALGIESFDEEVKRKNNLKVTGDEALKAIQMINEIGGRRVNGIPVLLPGINLIHGLTGESPSTFKTNYRWLMTIRDRGLLLKRINIRKLLPFPGTAIAADLPTVSRQVRNRFEYYRDRIRHDIDIPMLTRIYPVGTVLTGIHVLDIQHGYSLGKQIASYSITARIPQQLVLRNFYDILTIGHRERSLMGLVLPVSINTVPAKALEAIPGISKKRADDIILHRPFADLNESEALLRDVPFVLRKHLSL